MGPNLTNEIRRALFCLSKLCGPRVLLLITRAHVFLSVRSI
jgi:hypothetical protein